MRIKRYQVGGGMAYLPSSTQGSRAVGQTAASSGSDDKTPKVPGFAKETISLIKEHGLDSDVSIFLNKVGRILDVANDPTGENLSMKELLRVQRLANLVYMNYNDYKKARTSLDREEAWGELATDKIGQLYVQDRESGEIIKVDQNTWEKHKDEYVPLTNSDLMNLRKSDPTFAYRSDILDDISATVGMKTIVEFAEKRIKEFANTTITGYSEKQSDKIKTGLEHIVAGDIGDFRGAIKAGPDGVYKITSESTIADYGIKEALSYLYSTMPRQYKNALKAKATVENYSPDAMLLTMMIADRPRKISADYDNTASKAAGYLGDAAGDPKLQDTDNITVRFSRGDGNAQVHEIRYKPKNKTDRATMMFLAEDFGIPVKGNSDGQYTDVPQMTVDKLCREASVLRAVNPFHMSFANQTIDDLDAAKLLWDGQSHIYRAELPIKQDVNGKIMPDFSAVEELNELNKFIAENPGASSAEIGERAKRMSCAPKVMIDPKNPMRYIFKPEFIGVFATFTAIGNGSVLELDDSSKQYVEDMDSDWGDAMQTKYDNFVQYGQETKGKRPILDVPDSSKRKFYKGNVYIYMDDDMVGTTTTKDQNYPKGTFTNYNKQYQVGKMMQDAVNNPQRPRTTFNQN